MHVCLFVCMHLCMYVCMYVRLNEWRYTLALSLSIRVSLYIFIFVYLCIHLSIHLLIYFTVYFDLFSTFWRHKIDEKYTNQTLIYRNNVNIQNLYIKKKTDIRVTLFQYNTHNTGTHELKQSYIRFNTSRISNAWLKKIKQNNTRIRLSGWMLWSHESVLPFVLDKHINIIFQMMKFLIS